MSIQNSGLLTYSDIISPFLDSIQHSRKFLFYAIWSSGHHARVRFQLSEISSVF